MKITKQAYELLWNKLAEIEEAAISGALENTSEKKCLEIKGLVCDARQIIKNEFIVTPNDI